jgi:hypothetical protein
MGTSRWFAVVAAASVSLFPILANADEAKWPGIATSVSGSAIISVKNMPPGGEIWALWISVPAGTAVQLPAGDPNRHEKWVYFRMVLNGSVTFSGDPVPMCRFVHTGGREEDISAATQYTEYAGDVTACNYATFPASREENRSSEPYVRASLSIGGPWRPGMVDEPALYREVNGHAEAFQIARLNLARWKRKCSAPAR